MLFLASHHGDSQLLRIDIATQVMVLVKTLSNNAPILDFAIMDMGNREGDSQFGNTFSSGQARIVAGCGAYRDGSLRSIRSGVGLEDEGILDEIHDTKGLFALRSHGASHVDTLVVSSVADTRILRFDSVGGIEEVYDFQGLTLDRTTLLTANISEGRLIQITPQYVVLLDSESGVTLCSWDVPDGKCITAASSNSRWALISIDGSTLVSLNLQDSLAAVSRDTTSDSLTGHLDQISCLHAARDIPDVGVVGRWGSGTISIVNLATLQPLHGEPLRQTEDSASVPRDIALVQLHPTNVSGPTLLVALEDGNVVSFNVSLPECAVSGRKSVTLGTSPARLHILPQDNGTCNVFATTEHASLIYSSEGRIIYSATTADDATFVAPFDSEAFPNSIILSTDNHIRLCQIDKERLTHVKTLPMKETVRRVAYSPALRAFGLGCVKKELHLNEEVITSSFRLVDEIIFQELGNPFVLNTSPLEMVETVIRAELPDSTGNLAERFIVGTSFVGDDDGIEESHSQGRILVLGVNERREIYQIVSHNLKGSCRCLSTLGEHIVAGLSKTVVVYSYTEETTGSGYLQKLAAYRPSSFPIDLDISGNMIGVVDLMQSLSLLEFMPSQDGSRATLEERARHYKPGWATSVCHLDGERWLEADAQGNIIVLQRNPEAPTEQDRNKLEVTSEMNIGEQINRMRKLHVASSENAAVSPKAFLGSVSLLRTAVAGSFQILTCQQIEGTLYLFGDIAPNYQDLLLTFQSRLQAYVHAPGNTSFDLWRAFRNKAREGDAPFRFVDGEMIERFLDLDEVNQELVCEGLGPSVEDMRNLVEELRRMH
jgi:DNA damage-binding protein 1